VAFVKASDNSGVALLVQGGACRLIMYRRPSDDAVMVPSDVRPSGTGFNWEYLNARSQAARELAGIYASMYGYVFVDRNDEPDTFNFIGREFTSADVIKADNAADNFATLGLCEGLTTIRDEEDESTIALGIWHNGVLYVPTSTEDTEKAICVTSLNINQTATTQKLGVILGSPRGNLYGRTQGIYFDDLADILSESGLKLRALDCSLQIQSVTDFTGIRLQASTTDLWLNG
jgi:hypothetical protein